MGKTRVVSFHYTLTDKQGETLDSSRGAEPMTYMEGASQIIPGLEEAMKPMGQGESKTIEVAAEQGYGIREEQLVMTVQRSKLPKKDLQVGDQFEIGEPEESPIFTVTVLTEDEVTLDGNHPLAGSDLFFDIEVTHVREATEEETEHGHAHGADGHHHH